MTLCDQWTGERNPRWNGGRAKHTAGYVLVSAKQHPRVNHHGYVFEHRLAYEQYHKCCLLSWIDIHHINGDKTDNRVENLEPLTHSVHIKRYYSDRRTKILTDRQCIICGSKTTTKRKTMDRYLWYFFDHDPTKPVCNGCRASLQYRGLM
jgi:hypothetical protein